MAHIQQTCGDYYSSEETLTEALPYLNNDSSIWLRQIIYSGIAAKELKNYDDAWLLQYNFKNCKRFCS
jgi:hypothetical protein